MRIANQILSSSENAGVYSYEEAYGEGFEDMKRRKPNTDKLENAIGYKPSVNIDQVIEEMIIYFKNLASS